MDTKRNAVNILRLLMGLPNNIASGQQICQSLNINPTEANDAVDYLQSYDYVRINSCLGTAPYSFQSVVMKVMGRVHYYDLLRKGNPIKENSEKILTLLKSNSNYQNGISGRSLSTELNIQPDDVNDAVEYLEELCAINVNRALGTIPYKFSFITITSYGKTLVA